MSEPKRKKEQSFSQFTTSQGWKPFQFQGGGGFAPWPHTRGSALVPRCTPL